MASGNERGSSMLDLLLVIVFCILGVLVGIVTGLLPGLHVNNVALIFQYYRCCLQSVVCLWHF